MSAPRTPAWATALVDRIIALETVLASSASAPVSTGEAASPSKPRTFARKAERAAGNGFPCIAPSPCSRTDLRTAKSGASHDPAAPHWHIAR